MADGDGEEQVIGAHSGAHTVFVSYASADSAIAQTVCEALERVGVNCWIAPRDVTPGTFYADEIVHAIDAAKATVLILSQNAAASPHVLREIERATSKRHPVVSLRIDQAPLPAGLEYFLNTSHWLDASGHEISRVIPKFVAAVRLAIEMPTTADVSITAAAMAGTTSCTSSPSRANRPQHRMTIVAGCLTAVAIVGFALFKSWQPAHRVAAPATVATEVPSAVPVAPPIPEKSVAVLPFVDMSEKKDQEYFADGLSEELIDHLAHSENLKVIARTSSFQFKGKNADIREIGQRLGVANLLEGSVRRSGDTMRVTAQLVSVADGAHRWSETYDRKMGEIFKVQDEIAAAVVAALKVSLTGEPTARLHVTSSVDAYTDYLQGRQLLHQALTKENMDKALSLFRKSVSADPTFAEGWQYVMGALNNEVMAGYVAANAVEAEMRQAVRQVAKLAPGSSNAHRSAAQIYWTLDWNAPAAAAEYQQAYDLDPRAPALAKQLADALFALGGDEATIVGLFQEAVSLDPLQADTYFDLAGYYLWRGRLKDAEAALTKAHALAPTMPGIDGFLCEVFIAGGHPAEALAAAQREIDDSARRFALVLAYQALGRRNEADVAMADSEEKDAAASPYSSAQLHAFRGEIDQAFARLERAYQQRDYGVMLTNTDLLMKNLHGDPRWKLFLRKMKLPEVPAAGGTIAIKDPPESRRS